MSVHGGEQGHRKVKVAAEVALALGVAAGGVVAGMKIHQHRGRQAQTATQLEYMRDSESLPPLEERVSIFGYEADGQTPDGLSRVGAYIRLTQKLHSNRAVTGDEIREQVALKDHESLGELLTVLQTCGFVGIERETNGGEGLLLVAGTPDLEEAERLAISLSDAVSTHLSNRFE